MHLFIDTNIYLGFYHLSSDDLEELNKLAVLLEEEKVTLYVTDQVVNEFNRNREAKIADSLKRLKDQHLNLQFPQFCKDYPEYEKLREQQKQYEKDHKALIEKLTADIESNNLKADKTIAALFEQANVLTMEPKIVEKARLRMQVGNPPGKDGSLGDAISWELLLKAVPQGEDIYFITDDKDYVSVLDDESIKEFLGDEWEEAKNSEVICYKRLAFFFKEKFPNIKLATELMKELQIQRLVSSASFLTTHAAIAKLSNYADFTADQINSMALAAIENSQVRWIIDDEDVKKFYQNLLDIHEGLMDPELDAGLHELLDPPKQEQKDAPPF